MNKALAIIWKLKYYVLALVIAITTTISIKKVLKERAENRVLIEMLKVNVTEAEERAKVRYAELSLKEKDVLIKQHKKELVTIQNTVVNQKKDIKRLKSENDDLIAEYNANQTIDNCESVVNSQIKIIAKQDTVIEELGNEAETYSKINYLLEQKLSIKDTIIVSKENLVIAKDIRIRQLIYEKVELQHKNKVQKFWRNVGFVGSGVIVLYQALRK